MMALNAQGRFALTAFSPLLFNIALIAVMVVPARHAAGCGATAAQSSLPRPSALPDCCSYRCLVLRRGDSIAAPLRFHSIRRYARFLAKAVPGMMASSAPQLLMVAGAIIASSSPSAVSWLYFASRLVELPLGIVGVAMGTVLIPELTRARAGEDRAAVAVDRAGCDHAWARAARTLGLIVLSEPIVALLFEHGAFTADDTKARPPAR